MPTQAEIDKAKDIILGILQESGGAFDGKGRIFKTFYIAHLFHFEKRHGFLSDYPIVRMPRGPGMDDAHLVFDSLVNDGAISVGSRPNGPFKEHVYRICGQVDPKLTEDERESIREAIAYANGKNFKEISDLAHRDSSSWQNGIDGKELHIYEDILDDSEYDEIKKQQSEIAEKLNAVFGPARQ